MNRISTTLAKGWMRLGTRFLPFADAATKELPLGRLLRLFVGERRDARWFTGRGIDQVRGRHAEGTLIGGRRIA